MIRKSGDANPWFTHTYNKDNATFVQQSEDVSSSFDQNLTASPLSYSTTTQVPKMWPANSSQEEQGGFDPAGSSRQGLWDAFQKSYLSSLENDRLLYECQKEFLEELRQNRHHCCQAEKVSTRKSKVLSYPKSRITKRRTARSKSTCCTDADDSPPRTHCKISGCGKSTSREIDMKRHMKTAHGHLLSSAHKERNFSFKCRLCEPRMKEKKSRMDWVFPLKYNLTE